MFRRTGRAIAVATLTSATFAVALGATAGAKSNSVKVDINDDGCPARLKIKAGPNTFKVTNSGSGDVSEFEILSGDRIIGEVENVAPGLNKEFSLTLKPGNYKTACPGGSEHSTGKLVVAGTAATKLSADGKAAVEQYRQYLEAQTAELVTTTKAFTDAVDSGNLEQAKALYAPSRVAYERIPTTSLPAFGSVKPKVASFWPFACGTRYFCFCSSVPHVNNDKEFSPT